MGQQQVLLIVVGVIIVGISVSVALGVYRDKMHDGMTDAVVQDVHYLAWTAMQLFMRTENMDGWNGAYPAGIGISDLAPGWPGGENENGTYSVVWQSADAITVLGTSKQFGDIRKQVTVHRTTIGPIIDQP